MALQDLNFKKWWSVENSTSSLRVNLEKFTPPKINKFELWNSVNKVAFHDLPLKQKKYGI